MQEKSYLDRQEAERLTLHANPGRESAHFCQKPQAREGGCLSEMSQNTLQEQH